MLKSRSAISRYIVWVCRISNQSIEESLSQLYLFNICVKLISSSKMRFVSKKSSRNSPNSHSFTIESWFIYSIFLGFGSLSRFWKGTKKWLISPTFEIMDFRDREKYRSRSHIFSWLVKVARVCLCVCVIIFLF